MELPYIAGRKGAATLENILIVLQNLYMELPYDPAISFCYISKKMENTSTQMFVAILFTITKKGKQLIAYQPVTGKQNVINPRNGILFSHQKE